MPPGLTIPSVFTAVDRFTAPLGKMRGALGAFVAKSEVGLARVERGFRKLMSPLTGFQNMLRGLGLYVGLFSVILLLSRAVGIMADFEQAQVNISAVTGKSINQNKALADQARVLALRYGEAAKSILDLDLALIKAGFKESQVLQMAPAILTGSVALKAVPEDLSKTVGSVLKAWKMPASETQNVVDLMAKAADLSTMDWTDLQTMLPRAAQSAALAGMSFKDLLALFAAARNAQVHVASGSVAIKNMLIKGAIHGKDFNEMLDKIIASPNAIKKAYKMFGSRTLVTALPLAEARKLGDIEAFKKSLESSFKGYAEQVASVRLDSIRGKITLLKRSWEELVLGIESGNGPVGAALKKYLDIGSAMLLISSDSEIARQRLTQMDTTTVELANKYLGWLKIIGYITAGLIALRIALMLFNAIVVISKVLMFAWNVVLGIHHALIMGNIFALRGNIVALYAYRTAAMIARIATFLFSGALLTTPLGWAILGIGALVLMLTKSSKAYDNLASSATNANKAMEPKMPTTETSLSKTGLKSSPITEDIFSYFRGFDTIPKPEQQSLAAHLFNGLFARMFESDQDPGGSNKSNGINMNSFKDLLNPNAGMDSLANQLKLVQSGNVSIDINNKSGYPVKAKSQGASINIRNESTFMDY